MLVRVGSLYHHVATAGLALDLSDLDAAHMSFRQNILVGRSFLMKEIKNQNKKQTKTAQNQLMHSQSYYIILFFGACQVLDPSNWSLTYCHGLFPRHWPLGDATFAASCKDGVIWKHGHAPGFLVGGEWFFFDILTWRLQVLLGGTLDYFWVRFLGEIRSLALLGGFGDINHDAWCRICVDDD